MDEALRLEPFRQIESHIPPGEIERYCECRLKHVSDDEFIMAMGMHFMLQEKLSYMLARPGQQKPVTSTQVRNLKNRINVQDQITRFNANPDNIPGRVMDKEEFDGLLSRHARGCTEFSEAGQLKSLELLARSRGFFKPEPVKNNDDERYRNLVGRIIDVNDKDQDDETKDIG